MNIDTTIKVSKENFRKLSILQTKWKCTSLNDVISKLLDKVSLY